MKETILGIDQKRAVELGLDVVDVVLLDVIGHKLASGSTEKREIDGEEYVWLNYKSVLDWLPILGMKKRALALRLDRLVDKGLLKKHIKREEGNYTFFTLCQCSSIPMSTKVQRVCQSIGNPMSTKVQTKSNRDKDTEIREKEKDNNKLLSKKKDDGDTFERAFSRFEVNSIENGDLRYSLRGYRIKDYTALLEAFKTHVTNQCRQGEFIANGDVRNRTWLLRSMPYLDLGKATGYSLGYGEYIKDNRRWYRNRAGKEIEVPMDAPPRRQGTIWYKEEQRWGPDI